MRKVVDNVIAIVLNSWPALDVYLFDNPEQVTIEWPYDEWNLNDQYAIFRVHGKELSIGEPGCGCIIDEKGKIVEGEFGTTADEEGLIIDPDPYEPDPVIRAWFKNGYNEAFIKFGRNKK